MPTRKQIEDAIRRSKERRRRIAAEDARWGFVIPPGARVVPGPRRSHDPGLGPIVYRTAYGYVDATLPAVERKRATEQLARRYFVKRAAAEGREAAWVFAELRARFPRSPYAVEQLMPETPEEWAEHWRREDERTRDLEAAASPHCPLCAGPHDERRTGDCADAFETSGTSPPSPEPPPPAQPEPFPNHPKEDDEDAQR